MKMKANKTRMKNKKTRTKIKNMKNKTMKTKTRDKYEEEQEQDEGEEGLVTKQQLLNVCLDDELAVNHQFTNLISFK